MPQGRTPPAGKALSSTAPQSSIMTAAVRDVLGSTLGASLLGPVSRACLPWGA